MREKPTILVIDDSPDSLALMQAVLKDSYRVQIASSVEQGLHLAASDTRPDLIVLGTRVPKMGGYEVCRRLKADALTHGIPAQFLIASSPETFEAEVANRTRALTAIQNVTILALASLAETRDTDTGNHLRRTQRYVRALAWKLSAHPKFSAILTPTNVGLLYRSAPLHDIGKVGIPDRILLKPGKLTPEEFEIMKTHTTLGRDAIANAEEELGEDVAFLMFAKEIAYSHQEKWDGSGYPQGLKGEQIPVSARLMALADVYDALISRRVYKEPMPHTQAVQVIEQVSGRHFDPDVVQAFLAIQDTFETIALAFADSEVDLQPKVDYLKIAQGDSP